MSLKSQAHGTKWIVMLFTERKGWAWKDRA